VKNASPVQNLIGSVATNFAHFKRSEVFRPFLIIAFLSVIQQFSGMTILRAYVVKIFGKIFSLQDQQWPQGNASHFNQSGNFSSIFIIF
jgi:hypothetical protein